MATPRANAGPSNDGDGEVPLPLGKSAERLATKAKHVNLNTSHTIMTDAAPPTEGTQRTRANFLMYGGATKREERTHRIHATRKELLQLTFEADEESDAERIERLQRERQLIPPPARACSRQTGAIVYHGYDGGRNPFRPKDTRAVGRAGTSRELSDDDIHRQLVELQESVRGRRRSTMVVTSAGADVAGPLDDDDVGPVVGLPPIAKQPDTADSSHRGSAAAGVHRLQFDPATYTHGLPAHKRTTPRAAAKALAALGHHEPATSHDDAEHPHHPAHRPPLDHSVDDAAFGEFKALTGDDSPLSSPLMKPAAAADPGPQSPLLRALEKSTACKVGFGEGVGPAAGDRTHGSQVPRLPKLPSGIRKQPTVYRIAARTAREERERANPTLQHTPSKVMDQQRVDRRRTMLRKHSMLLRSNVIESRKVDSLVRTVMALNALDPTGRQANADSDAASARSARQPGRKKPKPKGYMQPTGHVRGAGAHHGGHGSDGEGSNGNSLDNTLHGGGSSLRGAIDDDEKYRFSLDTMKELKATFDRLQLDHAFMGCLTVGTPVIVENTVITQPQLAKCVSPDNSRDGVQFIPFVRLVRPDVPEPHFNAVVERWKRYRVELKAGKASFRERLDLAAVRDVERIWEDVYAHFGGNDGVRLVACSAPHDRGLTLAEFTNYVTRMNNQMLSEDDARQVFDAHCVPGGLAEVLEARLAKQREAQRRYELQQQQNVKSPNAFGGGGDDAGTRTARVKRAKSIAFAVVATEHMAAGAGDAMGDTGRMEESINFDTSRRSGGLEKGRSAGSFVGLRRASSMASDSNSNLAGADEPTANNPQGTPKAPSLPPLERTASIARRGTMGHLKGKGGPQPPAGHGSPVTASLARSRTRRIDPSKRAGTPPVHEPIVLEEVEMILTIEGFADTLALDK